MQAIMEWLLLGAVLATASAEGSRAASVGGAESQLSVADQVKGIRLPLRSDGRPRSEFYGRIVVGQPGQPFDVLFDPSLDGLWLPAADCQDPICRRHRCFSSNRSATFAAAPDQPAPTRATTYGPSEEPLVGVAGFDQLSLDGYKLANYPLALANQMPRLPFEDSAFDGVLGLARLSPLMPNLIRAGLVSSGQFGLWLDPKRGAGELTLGATNRRLYKGPIRYVSSELSGWRLQLTSVGLNGSTEFCRRSQAHSDTPCRASLVAGNYLGGPASHIRVLASSLGATETRDNRFRLAHCDHGRLPSIALSLDGARFELPPEVYLLRDPYVAGFCELALRILRFGNSAADLQHWQLGQVFLQSYYTIFDADTSRIGFAQLSGANK